MAAVMQVRWWQMVVRTKGGRARRGLGSGACDLGGLWWGRYEKRRGKVFRYRVVPLWSSGGERCWVRGEDEEGGYEREMEIGLNGGEG